MDLETEIKKNQTGAIRCGIGIGALIVGYQFDYGYLDDALQLGGVSLAGWYALDGLNYLKYQAWNLVSRK